MSSRNAFKLGARFIAAAAVVLVAQGALLAAISAQLLGLWAGGALLLVLDLAAFGWLGLTVGGPIKQLAAMMTRVAAADYAVQIPLVDRTDEIGDLARAGETLRQAGAAAAQLVENDRSSQVQRQANRQKVLAKLESSFGEVVKLAINGEFSGRVATDFEDAVTNGIANNVNALIATVDQGLKATGDVLAALADADLTQRVEGEFSGAFARLKTDTNAVADKLAEIVGQLKGTSGSLKLATSEILSGANDLSERTTKQAATIEETSAAMEQLASTVTHNAKRANDASEVAAAVTRTAEEGGEVMAAANEAMVRITTSSGKISNIIGLIDDIAFQTNLLALNASVEAARAGDAGKGFAVVAVEVRRLAQSAAGASSEIKVLIEQSVAEVSGGTKLVADAAGKLTAMVQSARSSNELMSSIAKDSREQASAIDEVTAAVRQMDEMTQHNAALVEEINASIEQTESQAADLDRIVDVFSLDHREGTPAAEPVAVSPAGGVKAMQERVKQAAKSYLTHGNAAVKQEWSEF